MRTSIWLGMTAGSAIYCGLGFGSSTIATAVEHSLWAGIALLCHWGLCRLEGTE